jgi:hypothetical protein
MPKNPLQVAVVKVLGGGKSPEMRGDELDLFRRIDLQGIPHGEFSGGGVDCEVVVCELLKKLPVLEVRTN